MPTKEEDFARRFGTMMAELHSKHLPNRARMMQVGGLAANLMRQAGAKTWPSYKKLLRPDQEAALLAAFRDSGHEKFAAGKQDEFYAIEVLAMSVVASRMKDPVLKQGELLLDRIIQGMAVASIKLAAARRGAAPPRRRQ
ncbi:MAG: hypothetical protein ACO1OG_06845 [Devosia sp.]